MNLARFVGLLLATTSTALPAAEIKFNRDVRPILSQNCFACHGSDAKLRKAGLRLDLAESALALHDGKPAIKPGDLAQSEAWRRIVSDDPDEQMPPPVSHKTLTAEQRTTLRRWIEQGAPYQKHWAFEPPYNPAEPQAADATWPRNGIDRFILARLEREGLKPRPESDRELLIRRAAFALTGLPPTIEDVDQFLADRSARAYEQMVDRYLASPRYGEEMARHWLDVARYADTHGLHLDNERQMWAYRDWVVQAFNENLPFDQFTIWQLAGDLLSQPTPDQLTATGFNRCNVTTGEGGTIEEEFAYRYAVDRAGTTFETWLGLTGGCAVCHDHKYDPLTTREFYSFYAFFNSAADPAKDGNVNNTAPFIKLPTPRQQKALEAASEREAATRQQLEAAAAQADYVDPAGIKSNPKTTVEPTTDLIFDEAFPFGSVVKNTSRNASNWVADPSIGAASGRYVLKQSSSYFFEDVLQSQLRPVIVPANATFEVWVRIDSGRIPYGVAVMLNVAGETRRVWWGRDEILDGSFPVAIKSRRIGPLPEPDKWTRLTVLASDFDVQAGERINSIALQQSGGAVWWDAFAITGVRAPASDPLASFARWWKGVGTKSPPDVPVELRRTLAAGPTKEQQPELREKLKTFYLAYATRPVDERLAERRRAWELARAVRLTADSTVTGTMIYRDMDEPRQAFVMLRGQYDKPGEKVEPGVPAVFPKLDKAEPDGRATRLDLARWLVSHEHPLTARVQVNRLWQQIFGVGLVKTSYDFGSQGEFPSHPELLDWLAMQYRDGGWDTKRLVRLLVTSATFRQQTHADAALRNRDPENRLLARGPRFRLDAEQIRDNALFVSGLINLDMTGPGVKPYQPSNIWEPLGYFDSNTRYYQPDHGAALYRRSLYVFVKRTAPAPFMSNFDAPSRELFCTQRERSDTPLQALQLMNDVQFFEAARALAECAIAEGGTTVDARVAFLYRSVLSRRPDAKESQLIARAYSRQLASFQAAPSDASLVVASGESAPRHLASDVQTAAWTMVANLLLNLDETINRN